MEILRILTLRGPNIWSRKPVLEAWVDLKQHADTPSSAVPGFTDRLLEWLPSLVEHRCSVGERGGFIQRLREGTFPAHILEHLTLELQCLAGTPVGFGKARETSRPGVYKVVVRYRDEQLARSCLYTAREMLLSALQQRSFDVASELARLRALAAEVCLNPSTQAIVEAAQARGIPACRLGAGSLVQLGQGAQQRRVWTAETDRTSAIADTVCRDRELTKGLLRAAGIPVPDGRPVSSASDAWAAAAELGLPVVVKPREGRGGRGVHLPLTTRAQVEAAFARAEREGVEVLVERFVPGDEHRLLVVGGRVVAAVRREPAILIGDGKRTVRELAGDLSARADASPGEGEPGPPLERAGLGLDPDAVPAAGSRQRLRSPEDPAHDVTDEVHPSVAAHAAQAARMVGLDVAGVDVLAQDIGRPLEKQAGALVQITASPGLRAHLRPASGRPRPVGEAVVATLFPPGSDGRIPIACVTGTNGKTVVARVLAHLLRATARTVGLTCSDGIFVDGRLIEAGDCSGPRSARQVLLNPLVEAAVFEAGRGGILREGLGFDCCDVAVVTNIGEADHLGQYFIEDPEQMFTVKRSPVDVVLPTGAAVLNAEDPLVARMAPLCDGEVIFFARNASHPLLAGHRREGRRAAFVRDANLVLAEGEHESVVASLHSVPFVRGGKVPFQVENALAAAAAAWALGLRPEVIGRGLSGIQGDAQDLPGRFNLFEVSGARVVVDDSHNASALSALIEALDACFPGRRSILFSAGKGRRDADLARQAALLGSAFDRVVLFDDASASDRPPGEVRARLRQGLSGASRTVEVVEVSGHRQAIEAALAALAPGEVLVIQTEDCGVFSALEAVRCFELLPAGTAASDTCPPAPARAAREGA